MSVNDKEVLRNGLDQRPSSAVYLAVENAFDAEKAALQVQNIIDSLVEDISASLGDDYIVVSLKKTEHVVYFELEELVDDFLESASRSWARDSNNNKMAPDVVRLVDALRKCADTIESRFHVDYLSEWREKYLDE